MFFITCVMYCCTQVLTPDLIWSEEDEKNLKTAQHRCREIYLHSPCLTKFKKVEERVYQAICGQNNNE